jgi:signal transduction histidine kinase
MRGRVRFVNEATLRLFRVDTFDQFVALVGLTIPEQAARLRPRMTSPTTIADVTEKSFSSRNLDRLTTDGAEPLWASDRRREEAEQLTHGELAISRALGRRRVTNQIISMVHPTLETEIIVRAAAAPIMNQMGRPIGAYYITEDVTEEMLLHGQRDAMLAIAGHDLRNPLTPAKLLLQQLQRKLTRAGGFDRELGDIDRVMEQLQRIQQIANDLDAVSATARGDILDLPKSCDLTALCQAAAQTQMQRHPEVRVHVQSTPAPILGGWGRRHMEQVLAMLVASAARRTPSGRSVNIRLKQLRNRVRVEVADQGEPMAPERLEAWNQVLNRGGAVLAFADGGDLDLSVVQTLLSLYRSKLQVAVKPRQGTTFWFMLPLPAEPQSDD